MSADPHAATGRNDVLCDPPGIGCVGSRSRAVSGLEHTGGGAGHRRGTGLEPEGGVRRRPRADGAEVPFSAITFYRGDGRAPHAPAAGRSPLGAQHVA